MLVSNCEVTMDEGKIIFECKHEIPFYYPRPTERCTFYTRRADCGDSCRKARKSLCTSSEAKQLAFMKFSQNILTLLAKTSNKLVRGA